MKERWNFKAHKLHGYAGGVHSQSVESELHEIRARLSARGQAVTMRKKKRKALQMVTMRKTRWRELQLDLAHMPSS